MRLHLTPEDAAFREEMRTFFTTEVPAGDPGRGRRAARS